MGRHRGHTEASNTIHDLDWMSVGRQVDQTKAVGRSVKVSAGIHPRSRPRAHTRSGEHRYFMPANETQHRSYRDGQRILDSRVAHRLRQAARKTPGCGHAQRTCISIFGAGMQCGPPRWIRTCILHAPGRLRRVATTGNGPSQKGVHSRVVNLCLLAGHTHN